MKETDLKKKAEELEQTLHLQLAQFKKDSQSWLKIGGTVLAVGLVAVAVTKKRKKRKSKKKGYLKEVIQEPAKQIKKQKSKASSFFPPLRKRLFMALLSLGQAKLVEEFKKRKDGFNEG